MATARLGRAARSLPVSRRREIRAEKEEARQERRATFTATPSGQRTLMSSNTYVYRAYRNNLIVEP